jgi:hypothetical protein
MVFAIELSIYRGCSVYLRAEALCFHKSQGVDCNFCVAEEDFHIGASAYLVRRQRLRRVHQAIERTRMPPAIQIEPVVCQSHEALDFFLRTRMDVVVLGEGQRAQPYGHDREFDAMARDQDLVPDHCLTDPVINKKILDCTGRTRVDRIWNAQFCIN